MKALILKTLCCLALAFALPPSTRAEPLKTGDVFPDPAKFPLEGSMPRSLQGKVVLVDFWASWCAPCKASFPAMAKLHQLFADRGLVILAVSVDEKRANMENFLKKNPAPFTVVRDSGQKLVAAAGAETMPTSFLLDREGRIRFLHHGFNGAETIQDYEREIEGLLKSESPAGAQASNRRDPARP